MIFVNFFFFIKHTTNFLLCLPGTQEQGTINQWKIDILNSFYIILQVSYFLKVFKNANR